MPPDCEDEDKFGVTAHHCLDLVVENRDSRTEFV